MSTKTVVISIVVAATIGVGIGRFSLPAKIETRTVMVEVEHKTSTDHTVTEVTETKKPDGTIVTQTEIKNDIVTKTADKSRTDSETTKTYDTGKLTVTALAITGPLAGMAQATYGLDVSYRFLGPISVNVMGAANGMLAAGIGISF